MSDWGCACAPASVRDAQLGAIAFPQRFGGSLNPHYHYNVLALDGVVSGDVEHGVRFREATSLEARDAEALARTVQLRVLRWFHRRGLLDPSTAPPISRGAHLAGGSLGISAHRVRRTSGRRAVYFLTRSHAPPRGSAGPL